MANNDNFSLTTIFNEHYKYCVDWLTTKMNCLRQDAEDCFMDALIKLDKSVKDGKFEEKNIRGWLITVAKNTYLSKQSYKFKTVSLDVNTAEAYLGQQKGIFDETFNPLLASETLKSLNEKDKNRIDAYKNAWEEMGDACKKILGRLREGARLKDLTEELGYTNYNSLKSTKARCMKMLKQNALNMLQNE